MNIIYARFVKLMYDYVFIIIVVDFTLLLLFNSYYVVYVV